MVSGPTSISSMPVMHFRPDPGEPAARLAAKEPQSAGLVTLQEQRNVTRLRMRAMSQGEDVIYSNRSFTLGVGALSPTFNGGLTTVVSKPDRNGFLPDTAFLPSTSREEETGEAEESKPEEEENQAASTSPENLQSATQPTEEELDQKQQDIDAENRQLERNILRAQMEKERAYQTDNEVQLQQTDRKEAEMEREMEENDEEKREIEQERFQQKLEEFQQNAGQILSENLASASSMLDVMFGSNREPAAPRNPTQPLTPYIPRFSFAG